MASASRIGGGGAAEEEEEEEQRQRERVLLRVREAEERAMKTRAALCPLGEALCKASREALLEEVRGLLDAGANVNYTDREGSTPLLRALSLNPEATVVSLLLERGADVNVVDTNGNSAMHFATYDSTGRCVELLAGAGADANEIDGLGATPLHRAVMRNNEAAVRALLAAGARRNIGGIWLFKNKTPLDIPNSLAVRMQLLQ